MNTSTYLTFKLTYHLKQYLRDRRNTCPFNEVLMNFAPSQKPLPHSIQSLTEPQSCNIINLPAILDYFKKQRSSFSSLSQHVFLSTWGPLSLSMKPALTLILPSAYLCATWFACLPIPVPEKMYGFLPCLLLSPLSSSKDVGLDYPGFSLNADQIVLSNGFLLHTFLNGFISKTKDIKKKTLKSP